ncbi:MAG: TM2 domain-containing protein [Gemmatimonadota bacterium]
MRIESEPRSRSAGNPPDPDMSAVVLQDLYRYPRKSLWVTGALWLFTGFLGGHRFYLDRIGTGILMLFTSGGGFIWWLLDIRKLNAMVEEHNTEQTHRELQGLPPLALAFMPSLEPTLLEGPPAWAPLRGGRLRLVGDALVLLLAGFLLGSLSASSGNFEGLLAVLVLVAVTNLGARWEELAQRPGFRSLDRWSHRLRMYYHMNDPGSTLSLLVRPLVGPISAFFQTKARAEVKLYLQLGAVFVILFTLVDLVEVLATTAGEFDEIVRGLATEMGMTFVIIYAFATPIGAILTTHLLLRRSDRVLWVLSGITVLAVVMGLMA